MESTLEFRLLRADEIDVRIGQVNKGGVSLLLYKDARADQIILDETVGPMNWQRHHSRDNANCIVSIRNPVTGEWIEKEDVGVESFTEKEKGLASDSFKRACVNWGIGRELYTAPKIFIFKDKLKGYVDEGGKQKCNDRFKVKTIEYVNKIISKVEIEAMDSKGIYGTFTFTNTIPSSNPAPAPATPKKTVDAPATSPAPAAKSAPTAEISDETVVLIGNCKGKKYGDVKDTEVFKAFMRWIKNTKTSYPDPAQQAQYVSFKKIAAAM